MKASTLAPAVIVPFMLAAQLSLADAAPVFSPQLSLFVGTPVATVQTVHCRQFVHVHRRCVVWRGGICRQWVRYQHRCG